MKKERSRSDLYAHLRIREIMTLTPANKKKFLDHCKSVAEDVLRQIKEREDARRARGDTRESIEKKYRQLCFDAVIAAEQQDRKEVYRLMRQAWLVQKHLNPDINPLPGRGRARGSKRKGPDPDQAALDLMFQRSQQTGDTTVKRLAQFAWTQAGKVPGIKKGHSETAFVKRLERKYPLTHGWKNKI
jgi:hypothetical protein